MITLMTLADIIKDKLKKLCADPTLLREGQLQCLQRKLKNKQIFPKKVYDKIYPSGSRPAASISSLQKIIRINVQRKNLSFVLPG